MTSLTPTTGLTPEPAPAGAPPPPRAPAARSQTPRRLGDRVFSGLSTSAGVLILITLAGVALFLVTESLPVLSADAADLPEGGFLDYLLPLLFGTVLAAVLALLFATPLAIGIALFISHYAPRRVARTLGYLTDLLAAIPSVIYGLWGANVLAPYVVPTYGWLEANLGFLPFFTGPVSASGRTILTAGVVLAVMILPIMAAINREVFLQTPSLHEEAALALGATRWEMIRMTVLPYGRSGVVGGAMLGLGRALGETIAVLLVLSASGGISFNLIGQANPPTIPSNIAAQFPEATGLDVNLLIATGLVLFVLTFAINFAARAVVARRAEFDGASG
ncbi:MAG: Phosphate transport system permease protein PstC [uncultured Frankineae bacterium]|uniref:Phosphate transport system permease protein n=1 Tax=uncultured Frankineae bacterium TaxID=437475 RepID=A0A6J4M208_9ACTN|nr:MAG: Phosphate transport system permease protein PstC [uncultured Frankineae bacterium]